MKYLITFQINRKQFFEQASKFAVDSLPITLSIVGMTAIILAMQVAPEMVKQGGKDYIGLRSLNKAPSVKIVAKKDTKVTDLKATVYKF